MLFAGCHFVVVGEDSRLVQLLTSLGATARLVRRSELPHPNPALLRHENVVWAVPAAGGPATPHLASALARPIVAAAFVSACVEAGDLREPHQDEVVLPGGGYFGPLLVVDFFARGRAAAVAAAASASAPPVVSAAAEAGVEEGGDMTDQGGAPPPAVHFHGVTFSEDAIGLQGGPGVVLTEDGDGGAHFADSFAQPRDDMQASDEGHAPALQGEGHPPPTSSSSSSAAAAAAIMYRGHVEGWGGSMSCAVVEAGAEEDEPAPDGREEARAHGVVETLDTLGSPASSGPAAGAAAAAADPEAAARHAASLAAQTAVYTTLSSTSGVSSGAVGGGNDSSRGTAGNVSAGSGGTTSTSASGSGTSAAAADLDALSRSDVVGSSTTAPRLRPSLVVGTQPVSQASVAVRRGSLKAAAAAVAPGAAPTATAATRSAVQPGGLLLAGLQSTSFLGATQVPADAFPSTGPLVVSPIEPVGSAVQQRVLRSPPRGGTGQRESAAAVSGAAPSSGSLAPSSAPPQAAASEPSSAEHRRSRTGERTSLPAVAPPPSAMAAPPLRRQGTAVDGGGGAAGAAAAAAALSTGAGPRRGFPPSPSRKLPAHLLDDLFRSGMDEDEEEREEKPTANAAGHRAGAAAAAAGAAAKPAPSAAGAALEQKRERDDRVERAASASSAAAAAAAAAIPSSLSDDRRTVDGDEPSRARRGLPPAPSGSSFEFAQALVVPASGEENFAAEGGPGGRKRSRRTLSGDTPRVDGRRAGAPPLGPVTAAGPGEMDGDEGLDSSIAAEQADPGSSRRAVLLQSQPAHWGGGGLDSTGIPFAAPLTVLKPPAPGPSERKPAARGADRADDVEEEEEEEAEGEDGEEDYAGWPEVVEVLAPARRAPRVHPLTAEQEAAKEKRFGELMDAYRARRQAMAKSGEGRAAAAEGEMDSWD
jgi:hypothetical protein